jgi:hypothetical protein
MSWLRSPVTLPLLSPFTLHTLDVSGCAVGDHELAALAGDAPPPLSLHVHMGCCAGAACVAPPASARRQLST